MQKSALAVFVKTPSFSEVKTRLAATIGVEAAKEFYLLSVSAVRKTVERLIESSSTVTAYWAIAEEEALDSELWGGWSTIYQGKGSLADRLSKVQRELSSCCNNVVIIGADSPQIEIETLKKAFALLENNEVSRRPALVVGPAKDGGFYLVGASKTLPVSLWTSIRYSTSDAGSDLIRAGVSLGEVVTIAEELDVDTEQDLTALETILSTRSGISTEQLTLLKWLKSRGVPQGLSSRNL